MLIKVLIRKNGENTDSVTCKNININQDEICKRKQRKRKEM